MKIYAENRKGEFNYAISDKYEAGIVLSGAEVKSVRAGHVSLKEAYGTIKGGEVMLTNAHISAYKSAKQENYSPTASRKLLLNKSEITKIAGHLNAAGFTLIPLKVYDKKGKIKVELGLGKGKKKYDKREAIKKKDQKREIERAMSGKKR